MKRNAEGYLWIVDRKKEFIKYKGFQGQRTSLFFPVVNQLTAKARAVAPAELEALLLRHPGVDDAGVVGVWSEDQGTELPKYDHFFAKSGIISDLLQGVRSPKGSRDAQASGSWAAIGSGYLHVAEGPGCALQAASRR